MENWFPIWKVRPPVGSVILVRKDEDFMEDIPRRVVPVPVVDGKPAFNGGTWVEVFEGDRWPIRTRNYHRDFDQVCGCLLLEAEWTFHATSGLRML